MKIIKLLITVPTILLFTACKKPNTSETFPGDSDSKIKSDERSLIHASKSETFGPEPGTSTSAARLAVGSGLPHRPVVVGRDDDEKRYALQWKDRIRSMSPTDMVNLITAKDGGRYNDHIESGLSPWIVMLGWAEDKGPRYCIPGSLVEARARRRWKDPAQGEYSLTSPRLQGAWKIEAGPYGMKGQADTTEGYIVFCVASFLARIPTSHQTGNVTLSAISESRSPTDTATTNEVFSWEVVIEPVPQPDRETLLSLFGYVIAEAAHEKESYNARNRKESKIALAAIDLLKLFSDQLSDEMKALAQDLLSNAAFKEAVLTIQEGIKKDEELSEIQKDK